MVTYRIKGEVKPVKTLEFKLCGSWWEILFIKRSDMPRGRDGLPLTGLCDYRTQQIYINNSLGRRQKGVTLAHEFMHAILEDKDILRNEEGIILALEKGVYELINSFPKEYR